jgi:lysophospholipase L1-like esterase
VLAGLLRAQGVPMDEPQVIARTGWSCEELERAIDAALPSGPYPLVSLLIGVNDQYRGASAEAYGRRFEALLGRAAEFAGDRTGRVVVLSIPDWGVSPFAEGRDRAAIARGIDAFNATNRAVTIRHGARYVDITASSRAWNASRHFVADGLHPAGAVYAEWANLVLGAAAAALRV